MVLTERNQGTVDGEETLRFLKDGQNLDIQGWEGALNEEHNMSKCRKV